MKYHIKKPDIPEEGASETVSKFAESEDIQRFVKKFVSSDYIHWEEFRHKEPSPKGMSKESLWFLVKIMRRAQNVSSLIQDEDGSNYVWSKLDHFEEFFHEIDMSTGGELFVEKGGLKKAHKQKLISRGIMEEAIASSQLEGAATSRKIAKEMLREGRKPKNESEQMIVNNYAAMKVIEEKYKGERMSLDLLKELHSVITKDTYDSEGEQPRLRKKGEVIYVREKSTGVIYHESPSMDFVKKELKKLIQFANDETKQKQFIHPVIKAIMLHFWVGYLHPFTDGNGRLARLIFYWYLIREGYWAFVFLPISQKIRLSPEQYKMAYVYSEQDGYDLTYFIDYNIKKIKLAVKDFKSYLIRQSKENSQMKVKGELEHGLNTRQVQLLQYLHGDLEQRTTLSIHTNVNQISKVTASKDLNDLVKKGFLTKEKQGRNIYYYGTNKIRHLFK